MIESITISGVATYDVTPEQLDGLSQFNFLFGANGTGKTTIGRVIADEANFPTCKVSWKGGAKLQPFVYNHDFVDRNFNQSSELKGVFTLGEKQLDTLAKIDAAKNDLAKLKVRIEHLTDELQGGDGNGGKKGELASLEDGLIKKCWVQKQKHDAKLKGGFEGFRNSAEKFKAKVLHEQGSNAAVLLTLQELEKKSESVFGLTPTTEPSVPAVDTSIIIAHETDPILKKRVIGKDDVDIAGMIKKLSSSDWVREGIGFYDVNDGVCPFCQRKTTDAFAESLKEYFDETFVTDSKAIADLATNYATEAVRIQKQLAGIIASPSRFLDVERLKAEKEVFDARIAMNSHRLAEKKKEASRVVQLESLSSLCTAIEALIDAANTQVAAHNEVVTNLATERAVLTAQIWKFVLEELKTDLSVFMSAKNDLGKAIAAMSAEIVEAMGNKAKKEAEIRELEKQITSIQPTIDDINRLLSSFGFQGFKLAKAATGTSYKLVRTDDSDAKTTLSEGEKTFVTFLYFYHLLKGSDSDSGMTTDRIVVFDDPVSSLDSDILFIVSSLIKGLFDEVRAGTGHIKQIFVFTHNVYFHKEVTYTSPKQKGASAKQMTFWIVRKSGLLSKLERHKTNPVKTSYELLWAEVRKPDRSNLAIQNTLRRILENYFKILGGIDLDHLCARFEGKEKFICKSLCSWVHDGSHYAHDDLYISIGNTMVDAYLRVFREIFQKQGQHAHYKLMMGDDYVEIPPMDATVSKDNNLSTTETSA